jgi:signal transduction histidine kinase
MISNLISNALQYSLKESDVVVRITREPAEVRLEVHNMGRPIPSGALSSIFEPFRRLGDSQVHGVHLGLGLYVVQQVARAHGGRVEVRSDEEHGTRFLVFLPRSLSPGSRA